MSLALASVVLIGAFHIHATFQDALRRQSTISKMQHTMKIVRQQLERSIRPAGAGMNFKIHSNCGGSHIVGPFIIHNNNTFGQTDTTEGDTDSDPDWFEVMSADLRDTAYLSKEGIVMAAEKHVDDVNKFNVGDIMGVVFGEGVCLFVVTHTSGNPGNAGAGLSAGHINHAKGAGNSDLARCYNDPQNRKDCEENVLGTHKVPAGSPIINLSRGTVAMRIDRSRPALPVLMMATGVAGGDPNLYSWQPVAVNVEDMQIAVHLDTSNPPDPIGEVWVSTRDLLESEVNSVRAVRISIVFRSPSEVAGWRAGRRPALEDRPAATTTDGYIRRVLTTYIKLRNMPTTTN